MLEVQTRGFQVIRLTLKLKDKQIKILYYIFNCLYTNSKKDLYFDLK